MIHQVKLISTSIVQPADLFSEMTTGRGYLFIKRPDENRPDFQRYEDKIAKDFFDKIHYFVSLGCRFISYVSQTDKQVFYRSRSATLESIAMDQPGTKTEKLIRSTDLGKQIDPSDIYGAINLAKEAQSTIFGKMYSESYERKKEALRYGEAKQLLEQDEDARDIIRLFLENDGPICIQGEDPQESTEGMTLPTPDYRVRQTLSRLTHTGLLAYDRTKPYSPAEALESEIVYTTEDSEITSRFVNNLILRRVLKSILEPYSKDIQGLQEQRHLKIDEFLSENLNSLRRYHQGIIWPDEGDLG
jgi:hypothetical protein